LIDILDNSRHLKRQTCYSIMTLPEVYSSLTTIELLEFFFEAESANKHCSRCSYSVRCCFCFTSL